jgi:uncharacterized membrane protein YccC
MTIVILIIIALLIISLVISNVQDFLMVLVILSLGSFVLFKLPTILH